jgi:hypothetical protein
MSIKWRRILRTGRFQKYKHTLVKNAHKKFQKSLWFLHFFPKMTGYIGITFYGAFSPKRVYIIEIEIILHLLIPIIPMLW